MYTYLLTTHPYLIVLMTMLNKTVKFVEIWAKLKDGSALNHIVTLHVALRRQNPKLMPPDQSSISIVNSTSGS